MTRPAVDRALLRLRPPSPAQFGEIERLAAVARRPVVSIDTGRFLEALAACQPAGRILELGAGHGGVTYWLARGARRASIVAVDRDSAALEAARRALERSGFDAAVEWIVDEARVAVERAAGPFDLVVLSLAADEARRLVDLVLPKVAVGGRIAILGALRDLASPAGEELPGEEIGALERLRPYVLIHPQLAPTIVPIGDGVLLAVKRRETIRELGGPY